MMDVISFWVAVKVTGLKVCGVGRYRVEMVWRLRAAWVGAEELQHILNWDEMMADVVRKI